ncbi:MAG: SDR family oxidoreductase [Gemmatimonadota bacterium]
MQGKVCVVTGANRGIGKEVARGLIRRGAHVVLVSRNRTKAESAALELRGENGGATGRRDGAGPSGAGGSVAPMTADLASQASIRSFVAAFRERHDRLDVLVNNAAVITPRRTSTVDGLEMQFAVNHLAPFLLTRLLLEPLRRAAPSRVVTVASEAHRRGRIDLGDLQMKRHYTRDRAYSASKLANLLFTYELDRRLREGGTRADGMAAVGMPITANAVHPGVIATGLLEALLGVFRPLAKLVPGPARGAAPVLALATDPELEGVSGAYFHRHRRARSSPASRDAQTAKSLWEASEALCGLTGADDGL